MAVRVPRGALPAFETLAALPDESFESIQNRLSETGHVFSDDEMVKQLISANIPHATPKQLRQVVELLLSLFHLSEETCLSIPSIITGICASISEMDEPKWTPDMVQEIHSRLTLLLNEDSPIRAMVHTQDVLNDNERALTGARILTELRPVFGSSVAEEPIAFALLHTLRLTHSESKEFYITLDDSDIEILDNLLDRARQKSKTLRRMMDRKGIVVLTSARRDENV